MKSKLFLIGALSTLVACATPSAEITTAPVAIKTNSSFQRSGITAINPTTIRTKRKEEGSNKYTEVSTGCSIAGPGYSASFTTPAIVNLPSYGKSSAAITLTCADGEVKKSKVLEISNITAKERQARATATGAAVGGLVGALVASGMSKTEKEGDKYAYPSTVFNLN